MSQRTQFLDSTYIGEIPKVSGPWDRSRDEEMFTKEYSAESKEGNEQKSSSRDVQTYPIPLQDQHPAGREGDESKGNGMNREMKGGDNSKEDSFESKLTERETKCESEGKSSRCDDYIATFTRDYK